MGGVGAGVELDIELGDEPTLTTKTASVLRTTDCITLAPRNSFSFQILSDGLARLLPPCSDF
jgi:hypothetical protein